jgi:ABC-2 type transport system ATP-binding protein
VSGRIIAQGTPDELKSRVGADIIELHAADVPTMQQAAEVLGSLGMAEPATDSSTRRASIAAPAGARLLPIVVRALDDAGVPVEDIALRRPTLDEVFLELTGHATGVSSADHKDDNTGDNTGDNKNANEDDNKVDDKEDAA